MELCMETICVWNTCLSLGLFGNTCLSWVRKTPTCQYICFLLVYVIVMILFRNEVFWLKEFR